MQISIIDENYHVNKQIEDSTTIHMYVESKLDRCKCPECGRESSKRHTSYERTIQDTPIHCKQTLIHINLYKYKCTNEECKRKVFSEQVTFAEKHQAATGILRQFILYIASYLGNETASKILRFLGVYVSNDTIQRMYNELDFKDDPDVEEVGIDDVAIRKGQTYATAIYDLKDHHLIELLEGRKAETLKPWLKTHPNITLAARDRASAYASAIDEILPDCVQVADRFHLLQNMMTHTKEISKHEMPQEIFIQDGQVLSEKPKMVVSQVNIEKKILDELVYDNTPAISEDGQAVNFDNKRRNLDSPQYRADAERRRVKQQEIRNLQERFQQMGRTQMKELSEEFQISLPTTKKYLNMTENDIQNLDRPKNYKKRKTIMDGYLNIIYKMLRDNICDEVIYAYVCSKGYQGSSNSLENYIYLLKKNNFPERKPTPILCKKEMKYPENVLHFKRSAVLNCLLSRNPKAVKDPLTEANIDLIKDAYPAFYTSTHMFHQFYDVIMGKKTESLDEFIDKYKDSSISSFCESIKKDITPIKNAISSSVSSGFVEGNNNKFKLIKRIVYGRAGLVNLSKKCKLAFLLNKPDFKLSDIM